MDLPFWHVRITWGYLYVIYRGLSVASGSKSQSFHRLAFAPDVEPPTRSQYSPLPSRSTLLPVIEGAPTASVVRYTGGFNLSGNILLGVLLELGSVDVV